jgi:integrase
LRAVSRTQAAHESIGESRHGDVSTPSQDRPADNYPLFQQDAHRIIRRRAKAAGIETRIGNHTFRATGITAYLKNSGETRSRAADREPRITPDNQTLRPSQ